MQNSIFHNRPNSRNITYFISFSEKISLSHVTVDTITKIVCLLALLLFLMYSFTIKTFIITSGFIKNIAEAWHLKVSLNIHQSLQNPMQISTMKDRRVAAYQCKISHIYVIRKSVSTVAKSGLFTKVWCSFHTLIVKSIVQNSCKQVKVTSRAVSFTRLRLVLQISHSKVIFHFFCTSCVLCKCFFQV